MIGVEGRVATLRKQGEQDWRTSCGQIDRNMGVAARDLRGLFNITRFRDHVHRGGPWDYKQRGDRYEPYGNFHYGAVGSAAEIAPIVLWNEAGRAQKVDNPDSDGNALGTPGPSPIPWMGTGAFGDDPVDQYWMTMGMRYRGARRPPRE